MFGWFLAGAWLGLEKRKQDRRRAERLEARRARAPRPVLAWTVFAVATVVMVVGGGPAVLPVMAGVGIAVYAYERKRHEEHAAWLAEQEAAKAAAEAETLSQRAAAFARQGMHQSAQAMSDLATLKGGK